MNRHSDHPIIQVLRRLKRSVSLGSNVKKNSRRVDRETKRIGRAFAPGGKPVLIHTYGKVGSTAIHSAIRQLAGFSSFQTHFISEEGVNSARKVHSDHDRDPVHLKIGDLLREELQKNPDFPVRVITLVRDPVARAVSNLFENPRFLVDKGEDLRKLPLERVVSIAGEHVRSSMDYTEQWFDRELSGLFEVEFFDQAFDKVEGFASFNHGSLSVLSGKLELLSKNGAKHLGAFLELGHGLEIPKRRARSATSEASLYDQVRDQLRLPADLLDEVYSSRICRYFYTNEELEGFRSRWIES